MPQDLLLLLVRRKLWIAVVVVRVAGGNFRWVLMILLLLLVVVPVQGGVNPSTAIRSGSNAVLGWCWITIRISTEDHNQ
jgi:hypothetical protein